MVATGAALGMLCVLFTFASVAELVTKCQATQSAADFAALAAAQHLLEPQATVCEVARQYSDKNQVNLVTCQVTDSAVTVVVEQEFTHPMLKILKNHLRQGARAGLIFPLS